MTIFLDNEEFFLEFKYIEADKFVKDTVKLNPDLNALELKKSLSHFKACKLKGELCDCGNEIWIIGSALSGKGCFSCITGESDCSDDYEIR